MEAGTCEVIKLWGWHEGEVLVHCVSVDKLETHYGAMSRPCFRFEFFAFPFCVFTIIALKLPAPAYVHEFLFRFARKAGTPRMANDSSVD